MCIIGKNRSIMDIKKCILGIKYVDYKYNMGIYGKT